MTNKEILLAAFEKAKKNGYFWGHEGAYMGEPPYIEVMAHHDKVPFFVLVDPAFGIKEKTVTPISLEEVIFSHRFAKAFWGDISPDELHSVHWTNVAGSEDDAFFLGQYWKYHLQHIVLQNGEEAKIKYLEKFI